MASGRATSHGVSRRDRDEVQIDHHHRRAIQETRSLSEADATQLEIGDAATVEDRRRMAVELESTEVCDELSPRRRRGDIDRSPPGATGARQLREHRASLEDPRHEA